MKQVWTSIFSFILVLTTALVSAQVQQDTTTLDGEIEVIAQPKNKTVANDSINKGNVIHKGLELSFDVGKLSGLITNYETKYEGAIGYLMKNGFSVEFEAGIASITPINDYDNGDYEAEGTFWRAGMGYQLDLNDKNILYGGVRYGASDFEDQGNFIVASELWGDYTQDFERQALSANWYEIVIASQTNLIDELYLGWKFRVRIMGNYTEQDDPVDVFAIPGYGRSIDKSVPVFNLYLKYRLTF